MPHARRTLPLGTLAAVALACTTAGPSGPGAGGAPPLSVSTAAVGFGPGDSELAVTLVNPGSAPVAWRTEGAAAWLSVEPASGTLAPGAANVSLRVLRSGLAPGTYHAELRIIAGDDQLAVDVTAEVDARPVAALDVSAVDFGAQLSSAEMHLTNSGNAPLAWSLTGPAWLSATPSSGQLPAGTTATVTLAADRGALAAGVHTGTLMLASDGGTWSVNVRVEVVSPPQLRVQPSALAFGTSSESASVLIVNDGGAPLAWSLASDRAWLTPTRTSGSLAAGASESVTVTASRAELAAGTHEGALTVTSNGGSATVGATVEVAPSAPSVALAGQVVDQFTGAGVGGLTVSFQGATATTDGSGHFTVPGAPSTTLRPLTIDGGLVVARSTFARSTDSRWLAIPSTFDVNAFDDLARDYEPRTIRWLQRPSIYIDTRHVGPPAADVATWINEAQAAAEGFVAQWSNGAMGPVTVMVGSAPPEETTAGWIVIRFDDDPSHYSGANTVGNARTGWTTQRDILYSTVSLRFSLISGPAFAAARTAVLGHELGHALGMGHMDGSTQSIMTPSVSIAALSTFDSRSGSILYSRSPGNTFADVDGAAYYVGGLVPAALPAGEHRWVCGAPTIDLDP